MRYVQITIDGVIYNLVQDTSGKWVVTNRAPLEAGSYEVSVTLTVESGMQIRIDTNDPNLTDALTLFVTNGDTTSGTRMLDYYPDVLKEIVELQEIVHSEGYEVDFLNSDIQFALNDAYFYTMGKARIEQWEQALAINPGSQDTLEDRRDVLIARIRGMAKLNTATINGIVGAFTGGTAISYVENSCLYVKIIPPPANKQYKFDNVEREIAFRIPAHLDYSVTRNYATWGEVKDNFASWTTLSEQTDWEYLMLWIAPQ